MASLRCIVSLPYSSNKQNSFGNRRLRKAGSAGGIRAGAAFVEISANDKALIAGLKHAEQRLKAFGAAVQMVGTSMMVAGLGITGSLFVAAKSFADVGSNLHDMSARTGMTVEELSKLSYAASQSGTDLDSVEVASKKLAKQLTAAAEGSIEARLAFKELGLNYRQLSKLSPDAQFEQVAKAIGKVANPALRAGMALKIFGKSGTSILPLIEDIESLSAEAKKFGLGWTTEDAAAADRLGDAFGLVTAVASRVVQVIGGALEPTLTELSGTVAMVAKDVMDLVNSNKELIVTALKVGAGLVVAGGALVALGTAIVGTGMVFGAIAGGLTALAAVASAILSPIGLITLALGASVYAFLNYTAVGRMALTWLGQSFRSLVADATKAFNGVADALAAGDIKLAAQILWSGLKLEWTKGVSSLSETWAMLSFGMRQTFADVLTFVKAGIIDVTANFKALKALLTGDLQAIPAIAQDAVNQKIDLAQNASAERQQRIQDMMKAIEDAKDEVRKAQEIHDSDLDMAKAERWAKGKAQGDSKRLTPHGVDAGLMAAKSRVETRSTFSAAAVSGMSAGDSVTDLQKKANDELVKLNLGMKDLIRQGGYPAMQP